MMFFIIYSAVLRSESKEMRQEYKHSLIKRLAIKSQMMPDQIDKHGVNIG